VRAKPMLVMVVALAAIVGVSFLAYRWEAPRHPAICQICERDIPKQTAFRMDTSEGTIMACCPTCAMHFMLHHPEGVRQALATDFGSGRMISAATAYYDEGGDTQYCTAMHPPVERGPQGVSMRVYDRCLPTIVAFATADEAEAYRKLHGGRILSYEQALTSVRAQ
jgi:hypothetical protein